MQYVYSLRPPFHCVAATVVVLYDGDSARGNTHAIAFSQRWRCVARPYHLVIDFYCCSFFYIDPHQLRHRIFSNGPNP